MMARFGDPIEFRYRYPGIVSAAVSILTGQVVEKCMRMAEELKQFELESKSPFVLVNRIQSMKDGCVSTVQCNSGDLIRLGLIT